MRETWRLGPRLETESHQSKLVEVMRPVMAHQRLLVIRPHGAVHRVLNHAIQSLHFSEPFEEARAL